MKYLLLILLSSSVWANDCVKTPFLNAAIKATKIGSCRTQFLSNALKETQACISRGKVVNRQDSYWYQKLSSNKVARIIANKSYESLESETGITKKNCAPNIAALVVFKGLALLKDRSTAQGGAMRDMADAGGAINYSDILADCQDMLTSLKENATSLFEGKAKFCQVATGTDVSVFKTEYCRYVPWACD